MLNHTTPGRRVQVDNRDRLGLHSDTAEASMDTKAVIEHHLDALEAGDLERTLSDYTATSVILSGGVVYRGLDALRPLFAGALDTLFKPGAHTFTLTSLVAEGAYGMIEWKLDFEGGSISYGTDSFHVVDGKIAMQTGAFVMAA
jgi:ketosteroid isomerase-like protein